MQINGAALSTSPLRPLSRPPVGASPAALMSSVAKGSEAGPAAGVTFRGAEAPTVSMATIMQHWGTSNPEGDLNTDGIVDAQDLAMVLNAGNDPQTVVQQNWGSTGDNATSNGDYNGDGMVDAMDLAMALNGGSQPRSLQAPESGVVDATPEQLVGNIVETTFATRDADADGTLQARDFADSGKLFERLDLDQNGGVGREELSKALHAELDRFREQFPGAKPEAFARRWLETLTAGRPVADYGQHQRVQQLFSQPASPWSTSRILSARA
jgi:hypothetical protein